MCYLEVPKHTQLGMPSLKSMKRVCISVKMKRPKRRILIARCNGHSTGQHGRVPGTNMAGAGETAPAIMKEEQREGQGLLY